jgi:hypothetical protein
MSKSVGIDWQGIFDIYRLSSRSDLVRRPAPGTAVRLIGHLTTPTGYGKIWRVVLIACEELHNPQSIPRFCWRE